MKQCPGYDWETCPYAKMVNGEVMCGLEHPEEDCDDYFYFLTMEGEEE